MWLPVREWWAIRHGRSDAPQPWAATGQFVKPRAACHVRFDAESGSPPGFRKRPIHEVDEILKECHWLARNVEPQLDTS